MPRALLAGLALATLHAAPITAQNDLSPARRAEVAARVLSTVERYFVHWDDLPAGFDLHDAFRAYTERLMAAPDRRAAAFVTMRFVASLGNSHTGFFDNVVYEDAGVGHHFTADWIDGRWMVTGSERDDLRPGDVIAEIDGRPFEEFYREQGPILSASTDRFRRHQLFQRPRRYLFPLRYTLTLDDGRTVTVDRRGTEDAPPPDSTTGRWLVPNRVALIRVPSWNAGRFQDRAMELLREYRDAEAIVVDVRGNGGGSTPLTFMQALMDRPWQWWSEATPLRLGLYSYYAESRGGTFVDFLRPTMAWPAEWVPKADSAYAGKVVILADQGCHSACEDFVMPFRFTGRGTVIGSQTAGSTGQPYFGQLGDGMSIAVGTKREFFPDGTRFEGVGIAPTIEVRPTRDDVRSGRDPVLARALAELGVR